MDKYVIKRLQCHKLTDLGGMGGMPWPIAVAISILPAHFYPHCRLYISTGYRWTTLINY